MSDKVSTDVFNLYKEFTEKHFEQLHECDQRIEGKLDTLIASQNAKAQTKDERKFKVKSGIFMAAIGTIFGLIGAFASKLFSN